MSVFLYVYVVYCLSVCLCAAAAQRARPLMYCVGEQTVQRRDEQTKATGSTATGLSHSDVE